VVPRQPGREAAARVIQRPPRPSRGALAVEWLRRRAGAEKLGARPASVGGRKTLEFQRMNPIHRRCPLHGRPRLRRAAAHGIHPRRGTSAGVGRIRVPGAAA